MASRESRDSLGSGPHIGRFVLRRALGTGSMGIVHLAYDPKLRRHVAIKLLKPDAEDRDARRRLWIEAQAAAQLAHPNTVTVFDVGLHEGDPYVAMEYVEGSTVAEWLRGRPSWREGLDVMLAAGDGLAAAHRAGLVHRDFKLGNILLGPAGVVKVSDFGLARFSEETLTSIAAHEEALALPASPRAQTSGGVLVGTPAYTAPEQYEGGAATAASDQFAFGVALYRVLYGVRPFRGPTLWTVYDAICHQPAPIPPAESDVPAALWPVVSRALAKSPRARFGSMAELLDALREAAGAPTADAACPYPGLSSFDEQDAGMFFGRSRELAEVSGRLAECGMASVIGPSGTGKSSFVRALVIPTLRATEPGCHVLVIRPGARPLLSLAQALAPLTLRDETIDQHAAPEELATWFEHEPRRALGVLLEHSRKIGSSVVLYIDQLEELYAVATDRAERLVFGQVLAAIAGDQSRRLRLVVSLRSDFVERVAECAALLDRIVDSFVFMRPPGQAALVDALQKPLERLGYTIEDEGIATEIAAQLAGQPGAFPLLQFIAGQLWDARDASLRCITRASVDAIGSLAGALAAHADEVVARFTRDERDVARRVLLRLVTTERTRARIETRTLERLARSTVELERVIALLVRGRLVVVDGTAIELVHETLISTWPTLRGWLDDQAGDHRLVTEIVAAARRWNAAGKPDGYLWTGEAARRAVDLERRSHELSTSETAFVRATSRALQRGAWRRRVIGASVLAIVTALGIAASIGMVDAREARAAAEESAAHARHETAKAQTAAAELRGRLDELGALYRRVTELKEKAADDEVIHQQTLQTANVQLVEANRALEVKNHELDRALADARRLAHERELAASALERQIEENSSLLRQRLELVRKLESENQRLRRRLPTSSLAVTATTQD